MLAYERTLGPEGRATIRGTRCERCGYTLLDNDEDVWSAVGL
jgi:hypothetical protein